MNDCIFCKIVAGQIPAKVVYQNDHVLAFRDVKPQAPVHLLIIPKKHVARVSELEPSDLKLVIDIHAAAQEIMKLEHLEKGFRLITNNGEEAGQTVQHLHYHMMGGRYMKWPPG